MPDAMGRTFGFATCPECLCEFERTGGSQVRCHGCVKRRRLRCEWCDREWLAGRLSVRVRKTTGRQWPRCCSQRCRFYLESAEREPTCPWPPLPQASPWPGNLCGWCGHPCSPHSIFCSRRCNKNAHGRSHVTEIEYGDCRECGGLFVTRLGKGKLYCSEKCAARTVRRDRKHRERAAGVGRSGSITLREVAVRDGWKCHLCGKAVPDRESRSRPTDPTIDHLIPLSAGGEHVPENVALAHFECNWRRSNTGPAQLRLAA